MELFKVFSIFFVGFWVFYVFFGLFLSFFIDFTKSPPTIPPLSPHNSLLTVNSFYNFLLLPQLLIMNHHLLPFIKRHHLLRRQLLLLHHLLVIIKLMYLVLIIKHQLVRNRRLRIHRLPILFVFKKRQILQRLVLHLLVVNFKVFPPLGVGLTEILVMFLCDVPVFGHFDGFYVKKGAFFGLENAAEEFSGLYFVREAAVEFVDFAFSFKEDVDFVTVKRKN